MLIIVCLVFFILFSTRNKIVIFYLNNNLSKIYLIVSTLTIFKVFLHFFWNKLKTIVFYEEYIFKFEKTNFWNFAQIFSKNIYNFDVFNGEFFLCLLKTTIVWLFLFRQCWYFFSFDLNSKHVLHRNFFSTNLRYELFYTFLCLH